MKTTTLLILSFLVFSIASAANYKFENTPLAEALKEIETKHNSATDHGAGGKIHIFLSASIDVNRKIEKLELKNIPTYRAIQLVCGAASSVTVVKGNYVFVVAQGLVSKMPEKPLPEIKIVYE